MIFNLLQKYSAVLSAFLNTVLIVKLLDLQHLGLYALLVASGEIVAVFAASGFSSIYLREIVKYRADHVSQRVFTVVAEIFPKIMLILVAALFLTVAWLTSSSMEDTATIALIGAMQGSAKLSAQKLRSHGLNSLSQMVLNARPVMMTLLLLSIGLTDEKTRQLLFMPAIIASFAIPAIFAYTFWIVKFSSLVFSRVSFVEITQMGWDISKELPGLFMLALGQKVTNRSDVLFIAALLGLELVGMYRIIAQIVTVSNASQFPIRSGYAKQYSHLLSQQKVRAAEIVARKVARIGVPLYLIIFFLALAAIYLGPYLEEIRYRQDFIWSLGIMGLVGLVKAAIPMIDNYVIYRNNANKGGFIQIGLVINNVVLHLIFITLFGLPGACVTVLVTVLIWRFVVKRFL